jgi:hypothetical protein
MKPGDGVRTEELARVNAEVADRLRRRGIGVTGQESSEELADLMVDDLGSSEPDDPHFVLPVRESGESIRDYIERIQRASGEIRPHRSID